jgi:aminopeptidase N
MFFHHAASASPGSGPHPNQTRQEARERASVIRGVVGYTIELTIQREVSSYQGVAEIEFNLKKVPEQLHLDYQGRSVRELVVNGTPTSKRAHQKDRITLPEKLLHKGHNRVRVVFKSDFNNDGAGLHKSLDPVDDQEYFYATSEPFDCNRIFPCFDQPDLKGTYALQVAAPKDWVVIASGEEISAIDREDLRVHCFRRTEPFSTYIFGLCAGPFACWTDPEARIPSRILAPQSAAHRVDVEEIFELTRQGFDFYEKYFEIPYPFRKYDQVFCPQFNWGAMENVACVCFNDRYLFRHEPTEVERQRRANTILHEMAHMWFGNLVTMEWWNDLWLNESFATYMANLALAKVTRFTQAWDAFYQATKSWAYWQDQLPTTHPIETDVPDTDTTHTNFDGITYGKGASVLKQLAYSIGDEAFRIGVRDYLKAFEWKNAQRKHFLSSMATSAGRDMKRWTKLWLQSSGTNTLLPEWKHDGEVVTDFHLIQGEGNGDGKLRSHALEVGLYKRQSGGGLEKIAAQPVLIEKAKLRVPELHGIARPDFVFANDGDHGFVDVYLDPCSLEFAKQHLEELPTVLLRAVVWKSLWSMIREGKEPATTLPELFLTKAAKEPDDHIVQDSFTNVGKILDRYLPEEVRATFLPRFHALAWDQVRQAEQGSDLQKVWFGIFLRTSEGEKAQECLVRMLRGKEFIRGMDFDQDKRWGLIQKLCALGHPAAPDLLEREKVQDRSERGHTEAFLAWVSQPDPTTKAAAWERFVNDLDSPLDLLRVGMNGFWIPTQRKLLEPYGERFFEEVPDIDKGRGAYFTDVFVARLYPSILVAPETLTRGAKVVTEADKMPVSVTRHLIELNDEMTRALRAREKLTE